MLIKIKLLWLLSLVHYMHGPADSFLNLQLFEFFSMPIFFFFFLVQIEGESYTVSSASYPGHFHVEYSQLNFHIMKNNQNLWLDKQLILKYLLNWGIKNQKSEWNPNNIHTQASMEIG